MLIEQCFLVNKISFFPFLFCTVGSVIIHYIQPSLWIFIQTKCNYVSSSSKIGIEVTTRNKINMSGKLEYRIPQHMEVLQKTEVATISFAFQQLGLLLCDSFLVARLLWNFCQPGRCTYTKEKNMGRKWPIGHRDIFKHYHLHKVPTYRALKLNSSSTSRVATYFSKQFFSLNIRIFKANHVENFLHRSVRPLSLHIIQDTFFIPTYWNVKDDLPGYKISFSPYKFGGTIRLFLTTMVMSSEGFWNLTRNLSASHCMGITHWSTPICSFFHSLKTYSPFSDIIFTAKIICLLETICRIQRSTGSPPPIFRVTPFVSPSDNLHHRHDPKVGTFSTVRRYPCYWLSLFSFATLLRPFAWLLSNFSHFQLSCLVINYFSILWLYTK